MHSEMFLDMSTHLKVFILYICIFPGVAGGMKDCIQDDEMVCPNEINIRWWSIAPYVYKDVGKIQGILPTVLKKMVAVCCGTCANINYTVQVSSEEKIFPTKVNNSFIAFPMYGSMMKNKIGRASYLPIVESPGILYFINVNKDIKKNMENALLNTITSAWPIMCLIYLAAAVSGIIMWALDCYWNPHQFPVNFFKGSWDGFWWACVSMTTVGYGDRVPKSTHARIFASIWVLVGVVAVTIFNAAMTSRLTTSSMASNPLYSGEKIVVVAGTAEKNVATALNVQTSGVKDVYELRDALKSKDSIRGALLDSYVAGYHREIFSPGKHIRIADIIDKTPAYGLVLNGPIYNTPNLERCFVRYLSLNQKEVIRTIQILTDRIQLPEKSIKEERSSHIIDYRHAWYMWAVGGSVGVIVIFLVCGFVRKCIRQCIQMRKMKKENEKEIILEIDDVQMLKEKTLEGLLQRQTMELEQAMEEEVNNFMKNWIAKKEMIRKFCSTIRYKKSVDK